MSQLTKLPQFLLSYHGFFQNRPSDKLHMHVVHLGGNPKRYSERPRKWREVNKMEICDQLGSEPGVRYAERLGEACFKIVGATEGCGSWSIYLLSSVEVDGVLITLHCRAAPGAVPAGFSRLRMV